MNKRVAMERNNRRDAQSNVSVTKPRKRNMIGEEVTRPTKKRKYVLVGPDWGKSTKMGTEGLDCLLEDEVCPKNGVAGPLNTNDGKKAARNTRVEMISEGNTENLIMSDGGAGPLSETVDAMSTEEVNVSNEVASPLSNSNEKIEADNKVKIEAMNRSVASN